MPLNKLHTRVLTDNPGQIAVGIVVQLATLRTRGLIGHPRQGERGRVGDRNVPVHPGEDRWMAARYGVEILPGGQGLAGPQGMVPTPAQEPLSSRSRGRGRTHPAQHLSQRSAASEVDRQLDAPSIGEMHVGVIDAGHHEGPMEVEEPGPRLLLAQNRRVVSDGDDLMASHRDGRDPLHVAAAKANAGEDISVVIDRNHGRLGGRG